MYFVDVVHFPNMAEERNLLNINLWTDTIGPETIPTVHKVKYLEWHVNCGKVVVFFNYFWNAFLQTTYCRSPDKSVYQKIIFPISQPKHMLWVLKRTVSMRRFF